MKADNKLVKVAQFNTNLNKILGTSFKSFPIYRSTGLITHLLNRKHFVAVKYIDMLPDIITHPDYAGYYNENIELIKCYSDNIFISIKLDSKKNYSYVATIFDVRKSKINSYVKSGRLKLVNVRR